MDYRGKIKKLNKLRIVTITLFVAIINMHSLVMAFDLDMTVDDDIRKNYNSGKLVNDTETEELETLPDLPDKLKNSSSSATSNSQDKNVSGVTTPAKSNVPQKHVVSGNVKISKGTTFNVVSKSKISDWLKEGTTVKFVTKTSTNKKNYTIPAYTVFTGEIIESHQPQISCNGGLVVIRVRSMLYKGQTIPLNAYVTRADGKMIFLNNIKGDRTYLKTMWKKGSWGRALFGRMLTLTVKLGGDGSTFLLSPFPVAYGTICFGLNTIISPVTAFFSKGKHVLIPAGSAFRIKLLDDTYIN